MRILSKSPNEKFIDTHFTNAPTRSMTKRERNKRARNIDDDDADADGDDETTFESK